jgi:NAD(P)-dependent dehydrogenase (short-subunit alcohol dehydrogenase family)
MRLLGKIAVITGAASGIGAATARLFVQEGAKVALADRDEAALNSVCKELNDPRRNAISVTGEVTDRIMVRTGVERTLREWNRIDVLVTCAAISTGGTVATIDETAWDQIFAINVKGCYLWLHEVVPLMTAQKSGSVVLLGSQLVASSGGGNAAYIASKGAIATLAKTMAVDHAKDGIRVNALMPGVIDTPMSRRSLKRFANPDLTRERWAQRHAMGRFGQAEEVAKAALFLASDESSFTTGSWLFADGGWSAM